MFVCARWLHLSIYVHVYMCAYVNGGQWTVLGVIFRNDVCLLSAHHLGETRWLGSPRDPPVTVPIMGIVNTCYHSHHFNMGSGDLTQVCEISTLSNEPIPCWFLNT